MTHAGGGVEYFGIEVGGGAGGGAGTALTNANIGGAGSTYTLSGSGSTVGHAASASTVGEVVKTLVGSPDWILDPFAPDQKPVQLAGGSSQGLVDEFYFSRNEFTDRHSIIELSLSLGLLNVVSGDQIDVSIGPSCANDYDITVLVPGSFEVPLRRPCRCSCSGSARSASGFSGAVATAEPASRQPSRDGRRFRRPSSFLHPHAQPESAAPRHRRPGPVYLDRELTVGTLRQPTGEMFRPVATATPAPLAPAAHLRKNRRRRKSTMMDGGESGYRDRIYSADWRAWKDPEVPEYFNPTATLLDRHIGTPTAAKTALVVDGTRYGYGELLRQVCRVANGLVGVGIEPGSRILMFGTDSLEYVATWFGAIRAGIVPVVVSDAYKAPNLLYFIRDTAAKTLFIDAEQLGKLAEIADDLPWTLKNVVVRGDPAQAPESGDRNTLAWTELVEGQPDAFAPVPLHRNDVTYMFYSGGTTGTAKGITHLAHDFHLVPARHGSFMDYRADDVVHATSKKYFTHGLWPALLIPLAYGATSVISRLPPTAENVVALIERERPSKLITVPTILKNILLYAETQRVPDFSSLHLVTSASEKMPPEIFEKFHALFGLEIHDSIGSSEITYEWIANRPKEFRRGSLGKPIYGIEVMLVDSDGNEITTSNVDGEARIKSVTTCFYYWRKYDKTRETFIGEWACTGDTLQFDEDGFFWFSGRSDDVFKVKGLWVSPIEVEAAITEHPAVLEAAVVCYDDTDGLTKPKAFVVLKPGHAPGATLADELKARVRAIGGYKVPEDIEFLDQLPRTTLMKIDRRALRESERARRATA